MDRHRAKVGRDAWNTKGRRQYRKNPEVHKARNRKWRANNPEATALHSRKQRLRLYGITLADYDAMLLDQDGRCALCGSPDPQSRAAKNFFIDHDHATGKVRALLCHPCNSGLGAFRDRYDLLQAAIDYLKKHQA